MKPVKNQSRTSWSKCLLQTLALGTIVLLAAAPARAVTFTWTTNAYLSGTSNFMTLAPGWAKLASFSIGGSQVTFGGETWSAGGGNNNMQASGPNGFGFNFSRPNYYWGGSYNGYDPVSNNVVNKQGSYANPDTGPYCRLVISGFVIGQEYQVQFIVADSRAAQYGRTVTIQPVSLDGNTLLGGNSTAVQYSYNNGNNDAHFAVVTADFVADATSYGFVPWCLSSSSSPVGPQINAIRITVAPTPPSITADTTASSSTNYVGSAVTFSAAFGGNPTPTLQWEVNTGSGFVPLTGATNTTLTLTNLQLTNSGASYALYASNPAGATNSTPVTLTVLAAPASIAFNVQFTGSAFGSGNAPTQTGGAVIGGDADVWNTFSNPNGTLSPAGLANGTGLPLLDVSSIGTTLTMDYVGDYIYCSEQGGNENPFTAAGSPYGNLMHGYLGSINGDTNTITLHNLQPGIYDLYLYACAGSSGQENYRVNVYTANGQTAGCGPNAGNSTLIAGVNYLHLTPTVTTNGLLNISYYGTADSAQGLLDGFQVSGPSTDYTIIQSADTTSDSPATDYAGRTVKFMAAFSGNPAPTLQWEVDKNDGNGYVNVPNATNATLTLTNVQTTDSGSYSLYANNVAGSLNSTPLTLTVQALPSVLSVDVQFVGLSLASGWAETQVGGAVIGNVGGSDFWNPVSNIYPRAGDPAMTISGTIPGLLDVGSVGTSLSLSYTGNLILNSGINTPFYGTGSPEDLMQACLEVQNTNTGTVTIQGLQAGTYDLYLYSSAGNALQTPVTRFAANGSYDEAGPNNNASALAVEVNYVHLTPVVSASGVLTVSLAGLGGTADASLNGLQLSGPGATVLAPVASFTATPNVYVTQSVAFTDTSSGSITNWVWTFGDGNSVTNISGSTTHAYAAAGTYTVSLSVTGPGGTSALTNTDYIVVTNPPPVAGFAGTPTNGAAPLTVVFTNTSSGSLTNSEWDFGDGNTATNGSTVNVTNTYAAAGTYTVSLVVAGSGGISTLTNIAYIVVTNPPVAAPVAGFSGTPTNGAAPLIVVFTNTSIGSLTNSEWDFGDGNTATNGSTVNVTNTYAAAGTYTVSLVVAGSGGIGTLTNMAYIVVTNAAPPLSTNALLSNLSISPGTLSQTFSSGVFSYTATNTYPATNVTVTATSPDGTAALALSFNTGTAYNIPLTTAVASGNNTMSLSQPVNMLAVQVVSQDGSQTNVYTVNELLQPSQTVPKLTNSVNGNNLVLSWPADHLGYRLLVQTNNLNKGVSANISDWGTVSGSTNITSMSIPIIKTTNNAYYRLVYP